MAAVEAALLATAVIGAGISAYGSYREGQDAKEASLYNAQVARNNAEMQASMIEQSGKLEVTQQQKQARRFSGTQKAIVAGSNIELSGSPLDVMIGTAGEFELDKQIMEYNYKAKAAVTRYGGASQAAYDEKLGNMYETSANFKAGSTLLTAASKMYSPSSPMASAGSATQIGSYTGYRTSGGKPYGGY